MALERDKNDTIQAQKEKQQQELQQQQMQQQIEQMQQQIKILQEQKKAILIRYEVLFQLKGCKRRTLMIVLLGIIAFTLLFIQYKYI